MRSSQEMRLHIYITAVSALNSFYPPSASDLPPLQLKEYNRKDRDSKDDTYTKA